MQIVKCQSLIYMENLLGILQNDRMVQVGRNLCGSSSPTPLLKQGHLQQVAQGLVQVGL